MREVMAGILCCTRAKSNREQNTGYLKHTMGSPSWKIYYPPLFGAFFTGRNFLWASFIGLNLHLCMHNSTKFGSKYKK